ncbi:MAG: methionine--tRNA ligase subunit beta [Nanoarchaeota archaeon]|nr:methionine--tRNA ligase subunit beta [Nanoarchaeota archaeon]
MKEISQIEYEDFTKLQLKVAKITNVEEIDGADKLYKLTLDAAEENPRIICAGIKEYYTKEQLQGKTIVIIANLKPRKLRGIESNGMLLAASNEDHSKVSLLSPDQDMDPGCIVN